MAMAVFRWCQWVFESKDQVGRRATLRFGVFECLGVRWTVRGLLGRGGGVRGVAKWLRVSGVTNGLG